MRAGAAALAAALLILGSGCTDEDHPAPPAGSAIPDRTKAPSLESVLLTAGDLDGIATAPDGIAEVSPAELGVTEDPDPRAACGRKLALPPQDEAAVTAFAWTSPPRGILLQMAWDLPEGEAKRLFDAYRDDLRPGCPPYTSRTPTGEQQVTLVDVIEVEDTEGARAAAAAVSISVGDAGGFGGAAGFALRAKRLTFVSVLSESEMPQTFVGGALAAAARRL